MSTMGRISALSEYKSGSIRRHRLSKKEPMFDMVVPVASTTAATQQTKVQNATLVGRGVVDTVSNGEPKRSWLRKLKAKARRVKGLFHRRNKNDTESQTAEPARDVERVDTNKKPLPTSQTSDLQCALATAIDKGSSLGFQNLALVVQKDDSVIPDPVQRAAGSSIHDKNGQAQSDPVGADQAIAAYANPNRFSNDAHDVKSSVEDVSIEPKQRTDSESQLLDKVLRKATGTSNTVKPSPQSFVKHTDIVDDSPASSRYRNVSRTLFEGGVESLARNKAAIDNGTNAGDTLETKAHQTPDNYPPEAGVGSLNVEVITVTEDSADDQSVHENSAHGQETNGSGVNALTLEAVTRAHRDDILEHQAGCNKTIQANQQDCEDRISYWQRKSKDDNEELTEDLGKAQDRIAQFEQGWTEEREVTRVELEKMHNERDKLQEQVQRLQDSSDGREKLQNEVQTLKTERSKHVNRILHVGKELEQEKKNSAQLKNSTDIERKNLQTSILAKGQKHQAEMQSLKDQHKSELVGLHEKVETERVVSKRKTRKLKHALKDMKRHYLKEGKTYKAAIQSIKAAHTGEKQEIAEQKHNDPQVDIQSEDFAPESSEGSSDDSSATDPAHMQLQRWSPKLQRFLEKLQLQNKQLLDALNMGKEEWQVGRKQMCEANVRTQADVELAEEEIERLREDHQIDPVRRSQWKRLVENKTTLCKRLGEQRAEDQEKIYRLQVTLRITNEKASEDRKASAVERVLKQKLVEDLSKYQEAFRDVSRKMSTMLTQQATFQQSDAVNTVVERSELLEEENLAISINIKVCSAKLEESLELLGEERNENVKLREELEDKKAISEDLCRDNAAQQSTLEWQKYAIDDMMPKQHEEQIYLKDLEAELKGLELSALKRQFETLIQERADKGTAMVLEEKQKTIVELDCELGQVRQKKKQYKQRYNALVVSTARLQEDHALITEAREREGLRTAVAVQEVNRLRCEMANGNKELCDPQHWANWQNWKMATLHAQKEQAKHQEAAENSSKLLIKFGKVVHRLWRHIYGFENLLDPAFCPTHMASTRANLVDETFGVVGIDFNERVNEEEAAAMDVTEFMATGMHQARFAPAEWIAAGDKAKDDGWDGADHESEVSDQSDDSVDSEDPDGISALKRAKVVVQVWLGQWSEKRAFLRDALRIHNEPKSNTKDTSLGPELYGVAGPDTSAETDTHEACPRDKTRLRAKILTVEEIIGEINTRLKKVHENAAMSDTEVFHDAVEELSGPSDAGDLDGTPADQEFYIDVGPSGSAPGDSLPSRYADDPLGDSQ